MPTDLPPGSQVVGFSPHGTAYWTRTTAIRIMLLDGKTKKFFLKVCSWMKTIRNAGILMITEDHAK